MRPRSLRDALKMMQDEPKLTPLAGCTDVYVNLQFGTASATRFIDLWPLNELRGIAVSRSALRIGALTTYTELIASSAVRRRLPMLVAAAREIGGRQIQNRGTLGGNIANASPAGDSLPVLAAADAVVILASAAGERRVPFTSFYTGYRACIRRDDELITAVEIPRLEGKQWWRKVGTRRAQAISKLMLAAVRGPNVRLAIGSVGPTVLRLVRTEAALTNSGSLDEGKRVLAEEVTPIDDLRSTAEYRRRVSLNLLERFWTDTA
ncbi:MAG TPA: FAD binding domain-containing protein [Vicinamibacterales bacterium]|nr:FAD binding domain-containing protein [Vicinamibacterales bacterium]